MVEAPTTVVEIIFDRGTEEGAEIEMVFSSILTGIVLATLPEGPRSTYLLLAGVLLSLFSVFRLLSVKSRYSDEKAILSSSIRAVEFFYVICLFHVIFALSELPLQYLSTSQLLVASILSIIISFVMIVLFEFGLGNYRIWWGSVFFVRAAAGQQEIEESNSIGRILILSILSFIFMLTSYFVLRNSIPEGDREAWADLREFVSNVEEKIGSKGQAVSGYVALLASGLIVLPVIALLAFALSLAVGGFLELFILFLALRLLKHIVGFLNLAYGTATLQMHIQTNLRGLATQAIHVVAVYYLFATTPVTIA